MTPVPFELPVKASEAASIAELIYQTAGDARRFAARLASIPTPTIRAYPGSLQPDPIHPSSYFLAVDGLAHDRVTPLLLRIAPASSPASGLFPKSLLIGRMRPADMREVIVNAVPFGPHDEPALRTFAEQVDRSFLPRVPASTAGQAVPVIEATVDGWTEALWNMIRTGNRGGWILALNPPIAALEGAHLLVERAWPFTRYSIAGTLSLAGASEIHDHIRRIKTGIPAPWPRTFDFEVRDNTDLAAALRASGRACSSR